MANEKIVTGPFRLAFPTLFEPRAFTDGGKPKYSVTMLFPKNGESLLPKIGGPGIKELRKLAMAAVKEKWGEDKAKWPANLRNISFADYVSPNGKDGFPVRDGDDAEWEGFEGHWYLKASSDNQPGLVDAKVNPILDKAEVFGGLICRAQISAFAYEPDGNKGVSFGLSNVQVLKDDGVCYGGGRQKPEDVFDAFGEAGATGSSSSDDDDNW